MSNQVKPGDLAVIIKSAHTQNVGRIVTVLRYSPAANLGDDIGIYIAIDGTPVMFVNENALKDIAEYESERDALRQRVESAERDAKSWHENFDALQSALVGNTGLSGITVASELRQRAESAEKLASERLEQMQADRRQALDWRQRAEAAERDAWLPIETAPRDGSMFLCWVSAVAYGENDDGRSYETDVSQPDFCQWQSFDEAPDGGWFEPCCGKIADMQDVTHWMPMPEAPSAAMKDAKP